MTTQKIETPILELLEGGSILLVTQIGDIGLPEGIAAVEGILRYLDQSPNVLHIISDLTKAKVLPGMEKITEQDCIQRELLHPKLGIQTMVMREKGRDYDLEAIMKKHESLISKKEKASNAFQQHLVYFNTVDEARKFLLHVNDVWEDMSDGE